MTTITDARHTQSFVYTTYIKTTPEQLWNGADEPGVHQALLGHGVRHRLEAGVAHDLEAQGVVLDDPAQVVVEAEPFTRLSYTWHTMTPEFADHIGIDAATIAKLAQETRHAALEGDVRDRGHGRQVQAHRDPRRLPDGQHMLRMVSTGWPAVISSLKTLLETGHHIDDPS